MLDQLLVRFLRQCRINCAVEADVLFEEGTGNGPDVWKMDVPASTGRMSREEPERRRHA